MGAHTVALAALNAIQCELIGHNMHITHKPKSSLEELRHALFCAHLTLYAKVTTHLLVHYFAWKHLVFDWQTEISSSQAPPLISDQTE